MSHLQPRGHKIAQLIAEFAGKLHVVCCDLPKLNHKFRTVGAHHHIPYHSKVLAFSDDNGVSWIPIVPSRGHEEAVFCPFCKKVPGAGVCERRRYLVGVYRDPKTWHAEASKIPFPMDVATVIRPWQAKAIVHLLSSSPEQ
eukprot:454279-Amphidinium_carterae.1